MHGLITNATIQFCTKLIWQREWELGRELTRAECRALIADHTALTREEITSVVRNIIGAP